MVFSVMRERKVFFPAPYKRFVNLPLGKKYENSASFWLLVNLQEYFVSNSKWNLLCSSKWCFLHRTNNFTVNKRRGFTSWTKPLFIFYCSPLLEAIDYALDGWAWNGKFPRNSFVAPAILMFFDNELSYFQRGLDFRLAHGNAEARGNWRHTWRSLGAFIVGRIF